MHIQASIPGYKQINLDLNPSSSVGDLKKAACRKLGIEPELTRLLLNGKQLRESLHLSEIKSPKARITIDYLWARQLLVWGSEGQRKLQAASILLAGAGAIGNEAAKNLAMLGARKLLIVDLDRVEMSNTSRMIFFHPKDIGKNKAEVLAANIHTRYPYVETSAYRGDLESMPLKHYLDSQLVVCGLDNVVSRIFLTQTCRRYSIPLVDAGVIGLTGRVQSYIPPDDTCPICLFPPNQYSNIVGLRNPCEGPPDQQTIPSFSTSISLVSSILAQETVKVIQGLEEFKSTKHWPEKTGEPLRTVLFLDLKNNRYTSMKVDRSSRCIVCGKDGTARDIAARGEVSIKTLSAKGAERAIRYVAKLQDELATIYLETSSGTTRMEGYSTLGKRLRRGDYLRILSEAKNGGLHESILRLV
jgi:molybdopterin/thiamine biosynthesis adenylyltransferase